MYFLVALKDTGQKTIVPQKWISSLNVQLLLNYGVKVIAKKLFKAFISNVLGDEPDFHLDVIAILDTKRPACYKVHIKRSFGNELITTLLIYHVY